MFKSGLYVGFDAYLKKLAMQAWLILQPPVVWGGRVFSPWRFPGSWGDRV
jgi:hypothetical protein